MSHDYAALHVFPEPVPLNAPARRFALIQDLMTELVDEETGEVHPPLITPEQARELLDFVAGDEP